MELSMLARRACHQENARRPLFSLWLCQGMPLNLGLDGSARPVTPVSGLQILFLGFRVNGSILLTPPGSPWRGVCNVELPLDAGCQSTYTEACQGRVAHTP